MGIPFYRLDGATCSSAARWPGPMPQKVLWVVPQNSFLQKNDAVMLGSLTSSMLKKPVNG